MQNSLSLLPKAEPLARADIYRFAQPPIRELCEAEKSAQCSDNESAAANNLIKKTIRVCSPEIVLVSYNY
jgi:hypothetical protein